MTSDDGAGALQLGRPVGVAHPAVVPAARALVPGAAAMMSQHAWRRVMERLTPAEQQTVFHRVRALDEVRHKFCGHDFGIRLLRLGGQRNAAWSDTSNGDEVWAILRRGDIKTVMLRRSSQPATAWALRVDKVVLL